MTRLTFGVSTSSFATIMAMRQNAIDNEFCYPQAVRAILDTFYIDDDLTEADSIPPFRGF